jgi:outer membrane immunogenic protein
MKKIVLAGLAITGLAVTSLPAAAADLPARPVYKAPVAPVALYDWSGFYFGGHIGGSWADKDWTQTFSSFGLALDRSATSAAVDGFLGGVQAGFNWQTGQWVWGIEGDWSWTSADGCSGHVVFTAYAGCSNVNWYGTVTGRVGYAWDRALLYVKGGAAFADEDHFITFRGVQDTNNPGNTRTGWTVGAGLEYAVWNNWSVKLEYNYMDFGSDNHSFSYLAGGSAPGLVERWDIDQQVHVVKLGVNYRFNWGAPVAARY